MLFLKSDLEFVDVISQNLGSMAAFFATYILQITFLSNCIQLLDIPHLFMRTMMALFRNLLYENLQDSWFFSLGYYQAYTLTVSFLCLLVIVPMPIVSSFAALFFSFRYYIEKYNILFVYRQGFESHGRLLEVVIPY